MFGNTGYRSMYVEAKKTCCFYTHTHMANIPAQSNNLNMPTTNFLLKYLRPWSPVNESPRVIVLYLKVLLSLVIITERIIVLWQTP
jgi:hypothetical protein